MMKKLVFKQVVFRLLILILAVVFAVVAPRSKLFESDEMEYIYKAFVGNKSDYRGMLEIWNIDAFESGIKSKVTYLEYCAQKFQKLNKGTYVIVRNLTQSECVNLIKNGEMPDVLSCSYGLLGDVEDYFRAFSSEENKVDSKFIEAGKGADGALYGLAWAYGCYYLISTQANLVKAGKETCDLNEIAYECGYEYKIGKKTKQSKSLVYAECNGIMPKRALDAYNIARSIQINADPQAEIKLQSQYSAYTSFLANNASILLGTHRDMLRLKAREESGKISELVYTPLVNWTDLVQFAFLTQRGSDIRKQYAEKFAFYLVDEKNQTKLDEVGLFSVLGISDDFKSGIMRDIIPNNISDLRPKSIIEQFDLDRQ